MMVWPQLSIILRGPSSVQLDDDRRPRPTAGVATSSRSLRPFAALRIAFGMAMAIDAVLKWLPGFRDTYVSDVRDAAMNQPAWLHGWFHLCATLCRIAPNLQVDLVAVIESLLAIALLFGVARRAAYIVGAVWMLVVWCVPEGFGGPYTSGATDIGTGIMYTLLFLVLLVVSPPAHREPLSLDGALIDRFAWWATVSEPHRTDRSIVRSRRAGR